MTASDSEENEHKAPSRRKLLNIESERLPKEEDIFSNAEIGRRDFFNKFSRYFSAATTFYSIDTIINAYRQLKIDEFELLDPRENHYHKKGVEQLLNNGKADLNVYVVGDDSLGSTQIGFNLEEEMNLHANSLTEEGNFEVKINHLYDDYIEDLIDQAYIKQLDNSGDEKLDKIKEFLHQEDEPAESDFNFIVGDFDTGLGEYKGTYIEEGYSGVCNVRTDIYTCNQVLHQLAHMMGAPQSVFMSAGDQMSWSPMKELRAHFDIVPYGPETKYNVRKNLENL